jgi:CBS domain-containing protein
MSRPVTVRPEATLAEAEAILEKNGYNSPQWWTNRGACSAW